jgi:integrase
MRGAHSSEDGARSRAQPAERPRDGTTEGRRASELAAGLAWPPATAMAEEREEPAPVGVRVSRGHTALEERNVRHVFTRILEKANVRQIRIHDLRPTYATLLLQAGAPITYVSQQMGHRDASITLRVHAHYLPDASRREVDRLDALQPSATRGRSGRSSEAR